MSPAAAGRLRRLDDATIGRLARHWEDGWNHADLDTIMAPFSAEIVFSSPGVSMMSGDPDNTTIEGAAALREYLGAALERTAGVRYTLRATYAGVDSAVLVYDCGVADGPLTAGADFMRVDARGQVIEWRCHF